MSAYNLNQFNLAGYNVSPAVNIYISASASEKITAVVVPIANNVYPAARLYETINKRDMSILRGRFVSVNINAFIQSSVNLLGLIWQRVLLSEAVKNNLTGNRYYWLTTNYTETIDTSIDLLLCSWREVDVVEIVDNTTAYGLGCFWLFAAVTENIAADAAWSALNYLTAEASEIVKKKIHLSQMVFLANDSQLNIGSLKTELGSIVQLEADTVDIINANCDAESNEILTTYINITMRAGQTLIIDASTYTVWLDGENILYSHSGDWLDELNRNTKNITISAVGAGNISEATILYTERFL